MDDGESQSVILNQSLNGRVFRFDQWLSVLSSGGGSLSEGLSSYASSSWPLLEAPGSHLEKNSPLFQPCTSHPRPCFLISPPDLCFPPSPAWAAGGSLQPDNSLMAAQLVHHPLSFFFFCFFCVCFFRAAPAACGSSQARGRIRAAAVSLRHSHSHAGSEPRL